MAIYTLLNKQQIAQLVGCFGLAPPKKFIGLIAGTVNTFYRLHYPDKTLFLKIDELGDEIRLKREIKILRTLEKAAPRLDFATPILIPSSQNKSYLPWKKKFVLLFDQLDGRAYGSTASLTKARLYQVGRALAQLHKKTGGTKFSPHRFTPRAIHEVYQEIRRPLSLRFPQLALELGQWMHWLVNKKAGALPSGLIHGDLFLENLHFKKGRLFGILDFEAAGHGPFIFDVAVTIHALCYQKNRFQPHSVKALLAGYEKIRKFSSKEKQALNFVLFEACLRFLLTRLRDFELKENISDQTSTKDFRDYYQRLDQINDFVSKWLPFRA